MKFDSLEAVLLGDEAWACELTMDELAFVGGGYGSGYGAAPVSAVLSGEREQPQGLVAALSSYIRGNTNSGTNSSSSSGTIYDSATAQTSSYPTAALTMAVASGQAQLIATDYPSRTEFFAIRETNSSITMVAVNPDGSCSARNSHVQLAAYIGGAGFSGMAAPLSIATVNPLPSIVLGYLASQGISYLGNMSYNNTYCVPSNYYSNGSGSGSWGSGYGR
jgi:hypothetical protein